MSFALTAGVPLELLEALDRGKPIEPGRDFLVVMFSARDGRLIELGQSDSATGALETILRGCGIDGSDLDDGAIVPPQARAHVARVTALRSPALRELVFLLWHSFDPVAAQEFADDAYLGNAEADFPDYEPVIGWSALSSGAAMSDIAFGILARRAVPSSRAEIEARRVAQHAKELRSRKLADRLNAVFHLGLMKSDRAIPLLVEALADRSDKVQVQAGEALAELGSEAAIVALLAAVPHAPLSPGSVGNGARRSHVPRSSRTWTTPSAKSRKGRASP